MKYDIKFAAREYEMQGEKKTFWTTHGTLWIDGDRIKIKMESQPVSKNFEGWFHCFEQRPFDPDAFFAPPVARPIRTDSGFDDMKDDIPF